MMNEQATETNESTNGTKKAKSRFPKWTVLITVVILACVVSSQMMASKIDDWFGQGGDMINLFTVLAAGLIAMIWMVHLCFFSRWSYMQRSLGLLVVGGLPIAWFLILRPALDGNMGVQYYRPIWQKEVALDSNAKNDGSTSIDNVSEFDFPRFLGSNQNSNVDGAIELDVNKFGSAKKLWHKPIGLGWSGFVARNGFAFTMEQRDNKECVTCYEIETGDLQWIYEHAARHQDPMNMGRIGPRATPTIHEGKVYAMGAVGNLVCLNGADGEMIWQKDINDILGIELSENQKSGGFEIHYEVNTTLAWGRAGSPLVVDDKIVVPGGGPESKTLLAFDLQTGDLIWEAGDEPIAYGSPTLETVAGKKQILITAESLAMGFEPETGKVIWEFPRAGASSSSANCSQVTVVSDNHVLTSKGYGDGGGELIALTIKEDGLEPSSVWSSSRVLKTKFTSPVIVDGHAYGLSNGYLECVDMRNGERKWKHPKKFGHGQILYANGYLLVHSEKGKMVLVEPVADEYKEIDSFVTVKGTCWNTFCLFGPYLIVRSELEAACFQLPGSS